MFVVKDAKLKSDSGKLDATKQQDVDLYVIGK